MLKLLFVCHGNICRSPMAESVCAYEIKKRGITNVSVDSAAAHTDEIGNPPHRGTNMKHILGEIAKPVCKLLDFTASPREIADPWYTRNFDETFHDVTEGVSALLDLLEEKGLAERRL